MKNKRIAGTVKWFKPEEGFSIVRADRGREFWVHYLDIEDKRQVLAEGERVEFDKRELPGDGMPSAINVRRIGIETRRT